MFAGVCGPVPAARNSRVLSSYSNEVGATVRIGCMPTFRFDNGQDEKPLTCLQSGQWQGVEDCLGESSHIKMMM